MSFIGIEVPAFFSPSPGNNKSKSKKCCGSNSRFMKPRQSTSDSALPCNSCQPHKMESFNKRHVLKCSQSLPSHVNPSTQYFLKSKSEQSHIEETSKTKPKSKFRSINVNKKNQPRHQFNYLECGENLQEKECLNYSSKATNSLAEGTLQNSQEKDNFNEDCDLFRYFPSPKSPHKVQFVVEKAKFGQKVKHGKLCSSTMCSCSTALTKIVCDQTAFYTAPIDCNNSFTCLPSLSQGGQGFGNFGLETDSVLVAHIPPIPISANETTHILINLPADVVTTRADTVELFATSDKQTDESDLDVVNSSDYCPSRKCGTIYSSSSSILLPSSKLQIKKQ